jgi:PAS domain S-box-containing protein
MGYEPDHLLGKELTRIIPTGEHEMVNEYFASLRNRGQKKGLGTIHLIHASGQLLPVSVAGAIERWGKEATTYVIAVQDITPQKKAEQEKERSQEIFERIFEELPVMVTIFDPELNKITVNKEFEKVTGWKKDEVNKIDLLKACYPNEETRAEAREWMQKDRAGWKELVLTTRQGHKRNQEWCNIHLSDDTIIGIGMDVTALKEKERELKESKSLFESIFNTAEAGLCLTDRDGYFRMVNKAYCEIYGYSKEELIGDRITKILPEAAHEEALEVSRKFVDGEQQSLPRTWQVINKRGEQLDIRVSGSLIDTGTEKLQIT